MYRHPGQLSIPTPHSQWASTLEDATRFGSGSVALAPDTDWDPSNSFDDMDKWKDLHPDEDLHDKDTRPFDSVSIGLLRTVGVRTLRIMAISE